ncbi:MAG: hypothetical protein ACI8PZ_005568 [Myxococcota bacterium]|jgi:hypothetical protein
MSRHWLDGPCARWHDARVTQPDDRPRMLDIRSNEADAQGNRVLTLDMPALRTHPAQVAKALRARTPFTLEWTVTHGKHSKQGRLDPTTLPLTLVFRRGHDPDGAWNLRIVAVGTDGRWRKELWKQLLWVQPNLRVPDAQVAALAEKFAPIFLYSDKEQHFPVSLSTLLDGDLVNNSTERMKLKTIFGRESIPLRDLGTFLRYNGHADYLLDYGFLSMRRSIYAQLGGDPRNCTVYWSYLEDPASDRFFLTYHLIYAYDTKTGLARFTGIGPHVFDRESMVLVFDRWDRPSAMIISGHLEDQTIFFLDKLKVWHQGRVRVPFDDPRTLKLGDHPVIAVAEGSHALYPTSGVYQLSLLRELAGYMHHEVMASDGAQPIPMRADQMIVPPRLDGPLPTYTLRNMGLDRLCSTLNPTATDYDGSNAYLVFSGFWVDVPGTQNARFPPFTKKVTGIHSWVDGAYGWNWDDVPDRYHRNNRLILRYLHENLEDL